MTQLMNLNIANDSDGSYEGICFCTYFLAALQCSHCRVQHTSRKTSATSQTQAPPLLAVHRRAVVVLSLEFPRSAGVRTRHLHADVVLWPRPMAAYLGLRYIRVQSIQSSPTWTPWQDIDTMCGLSSTAAALLPCFEARSSCPAGTSQRSSPTLSAAEIYSKEAPAGSRITFPSASSSCKRPFKLVVLQTKEIRRPHYES